LIDRPGSVVVEEIIRRGGRLVSEDIGFAELVLTAGWYIWWERRKNVYGEYVQTPFRSALSIIVLSKKLYDSKEQTECKTEGRMEETFGR
jgi:hypothetical protein